MEIGDDVNDKFENQVATYSDRPMTKDLTKIVYAEHLSPKKRFASLFSETEWEDYVDIQKIRYEKLNV